MSFAKLLIMPEDNDFWREPITWWHFSSVSVLVYDNHFLLLSPFLRCCMNFYILKFLSIDQYGWTYSKKLNPIFGNHFIFKLFLKKKVNSGKWHVFKRKVNYKIWKTMSTLLAASLLVNLMIQWSTYSFGSFWCT